MKYQLKYFLMCTVDGSADDKPTTAEIDAGNDIEAITTANALLDSKRSSLTIPWAPILCQDLRPVATGNPAHPPTAHYLAWVGNHQNTDAFDALAVNACAEWKEAFLSFVRTGEAGDAYLKHLENCLQCQAMIEEAFERTAAALEKLSLHLNEAR